MPHERDFKGYGRTPPDVRWPDGSGLALNFVLNVEEGSEYSIGNGDGRTDAALTEVRASRVPEGQRDLAAESMYEYGSRVGFWRIYNFFKDRGLPLTIFACAQALEKNPDIAEALQETDWDICAHGDRWIEHYRLDAKTEREHIDRATTTIEKLTGRRPKGWYCRYAPSEATRELIVAHGGYLYDSDAYNDELPYWTNVQGRGHLVLPYSLVTNDAKFLSGDVHRGSAYAEFLTDTFDVLKREADTRPRMMSVGMHARIIGHPGRFAGLQRFVDHVQKADKVWVARREDIALHWKANVSNTIGGPNA